MKLKMEVYLKGMNKKIKRIIQVNDDMTLQLFCEYTILSMNGNCKHLYQLVLNEEHSYLGPDCEIIDYDCEEMMEDTKLSDLELETGSKMMLNYDFQNDWEFNIKVLETEKGYYDDDFKVISGTATGIIEDVFGVWELKNIFKILNDTQRRPYYERKINDLKYYDEKNCDIEKINFKIKHYLDYYRELNKPKRYEMNVSLEGFNTEIKRKICADSNIKLDKFCRMIIYSMRGDMSHGYGLKKGKEYIDEDIMERHDLNYLELKCNQRLKVIYDWGDNWIFNISVRKVIDGYSPRKKFEVLSGKGYGIIDDCGGIGGLYEIFEGENTDWGKYDINDFDLKKINRIIDCCF